MKMYDILVRVGGSRDNEVWKRGVTPAEVFLLNAMHGGEAISELEELKETKDYDSSIKMRKLRNALRNKYGGNPKNLKIFDGMFGIHPQPLPPSVSKEDLLPEVDEDYGIEEDDLDDEDDDESEQAEAPQPESVKVPEPPTEQQVLKSKIAALGGHVPKGNVAIAKLEEVLADLTEAAAEPQSVLD